MSRKLAARRAYFHNLIAGQAATRQQLVRRISHGKKPCALLTDGKQKQPSVFERFNPARVRIVPGFQFHCRSSRDARSEFAIHGGCRERTRREDTPSRLLRIVAALGAELRPDTV